MAHRPKLSRALREAVFARDGRSCLKCGKTDPPGQAGEVCIDHKVPRHRGGADTIENLQVLCSTCNSIKGLLTPEELDFVEYLETRARAIRRRAAAGQPPTPIDWGLVQ